MSDHADKFPGRHLRPCRSSNHRDHGEDYEDKRITYKEWHKEQARALTEYIFARLMDHPGGEGEDGRDVTDTTRSETTHQVETFLDNFSSDEELASPEQETRLIPHVSFTQHTVSTIAGINLYTKELNLSLCRIEKISPLRNVIQCKGDTESKALHHDGGKLNLLLPMKPFSTNSGGSFQQKDYDDGPMALAYKKVLSVRLTQLHNNIHLYPSQAAKQITVYFYNDCAEALDRFFDDTRNGNSTNFFDYYLRLTKVPGKCIFPYTEHVVPEATQEVTTVPYCICLGGKSQMSLHWSPPSSIESNDKIDFCCGGVSILSTTSKEATESVLSSNECTIMFDELQQDSDSDVINGPLQQSLSAWKSSLRNNDDAQQQQQVEEASTPRQPQDKDSTEQESTMMIERECQQKMNHTTSSIAGVGTSTVAAVPPSLESFLIPVPEHFKSHVAFPPQCRVMQTTHFEQQTEAQQVSRVFIHVVTGARICQLDSGEYCQEKHLSYARNVPVSVKLPNESSYSRGIVINSRVSQGEEEYLQYRIALTNGTICDYIDRSHVVYHEIAMELDSAPPERGRRRKRRKRSKARKSDSTSSRRLTTDDAAMDKNDATTITQSHEVDVVAKATQGDEGCVAPVQSIIRAEKNNSFSITCSLPTTNTRRIMFPQNWKNIRIRNSLEGIHEKTGCIVQLYGFGLSGSSEIGVHKCMDVTGQNDKLDSAVKIIWQALATYGTDPLDSVRAMYEVTLANLKESQQSKKGRKNKAGCPALLMEMPPDFLHEKWVSVLPISGDRVEHIVQHPSIRKMQLKTRCVIKGYQVRVPYVSVEGPSKEAVTSMTTRVQQLLKQDAAEQRRKRQAQIRMDNEAKIRMDNEAKIRMDNEAKTRMDNEAKTRMDNEAKIRMDNYPPTTAGKHSVISGLPPTMMLLENTP